MSIDCRSEEGITIGLIDSIISICRILARRDLEQTDNIKEALIDLAHDEDVHKVTVAGLDERKILKQLAERLGKPQFIHD